MAEPTYKSTDGNSYGNPAADDKTFLAGYLFGIPVRDLGLFSTIVMSIAVGFSAFFVATFLAIVTMLILSANGHTVEYSETYTYVGLPVGLVVLALSSFYLGMLWIKRHITRR